MKPVTVCLNESGLSRRARLGARRMFLASVARGGQLLTMWTTQLKRAGDDMDNNNGRERLSIALRKITETLMRWDAHIENCAECRAFEKNKMHGCCDVGRAIVNELLKLML